MIARFHNPVDTRFGWGSLHQLADITEHQTVALVTFPEARGLGLVDRIQDLLGDRLVYVIEDVQPNPDVAQLRDTYERFWQEAGDCHAVIAVGWLRIFRQPGVVVAWWVPVRRIIRGRRLQLRWFRAAPTAAAARLANASVLRRFAGQRALIVRITGRRGFGRGHAWHPG